MAGIVIVGGLVFLHGLGLIFLIWLAGKILDILFGY